MIILVVAAHPDDEVLGCGGTIARLAKEGHDVFVLILGGGMTSRGEIEKEKIDQLRNDATEANKIIYVKKVYFCDFPDNKFDSVPLLDIVKAVEKLKNELRPDIIFTHHENDLNIDHKITYKAVITAARPMEGESVKEIYSFEVLSSTEWNYPLSFSPDVFFDMSNTLDLKLKAMETYKTELREFPHPRSLEGIRLNSKHWGMKTGLKEAEAFKCVRIMK